MEYLQYVNVLNVIDAKGYNVLNLVINGIPSIPLIWIRILILWLFDSLFKG